MSTSLPLQVIFGVSDFWAIIEVHLREGNYNEEGWTETLCYWEGDDMDHESLIKDNYIFVEPEAEYSRGIEMLPEKLLGYYVR